MFLHHLKLNTFELSSDTDYNMKYCVVHYYTVELVVSFQLKENLSRKLTRYRTIYKL